MITETKHVDDVEYRIEHYFDTTECYDIVKDAAEKYWNSRKKNEAYENYRFDNQAVHWSLGPMLANNKFDLGFTLLYRSGNLLSVGGIRTYTNTVALILGRHFGFFTLAPATHALLIPFQLNICRQANLKEGWLTVNNYNYWQKIWYSNDASTRQFNRNKNSKLHQLAKETADGCTMLGQATVNNVLQDVLSWKIN